MIIASLIVKSFALFESKISMALENKARMSPNSFLKMPSILESLGQPQKDPSVLNLKDLTIG